MRKGQKMPPEQKAKIRASVRKAQAAAREEKASSGGVPVEAVAPIETVGGVVVDIAGASPETAPKSLLERIKAGMKQPPTPEKGKKKEDQAESNFLFAFVPLASGFLAYYSGRFWADEYKACAPTAEEVSAILTPLVRLTSRYLDVRLAETPDIRDIRLSLTALLLFVVRSAKLSIEITHKLEEQRAVEHAEKLTNTRQYPGDHQGSSGAGSPGHGDSRGRASESAGARTVGNAENAFGRESGGSVPNNEFGPDPNAFATDAEWARALINQEFQRDRQYRALHGLL